MLLVIDNYDSFTYNLVQELGELGADIRVYRNDKITVPEAEKLGPDRIIVSPGPCTPNEAGISVYQSPLEVAVLITGWLGFWSVGQPA